MRDELPDNSGIIAKEHLRNFIFAGRALFTVVQPEVRFTFKVRQGYLPHIHLVRVRLEHKYEYIGMLRHKLYNHDLRSHVAPDEPEAHAARWFFEHIRAGTLPDNTCVYHHGRCGQCARVLTVPESIESGLGPICAGRQ